jgi:carboxypeptidase Taq
MTEALTAYTDLEARFRRRGALSQAARMLTWDSATMMPEGGAPARSEQLAVLSVTCHELLTDSAVAELLAGAEAESESLGPWQRANLREMTRQWRHATALDSDLVEALSKAGQHCEMVWRKARPAADFAAVLPSLEALLELKREAAGAKAEAFGCAPYDALLDQYDPGLTAAKIDRIFDPLAAFLPGFLEQVLAKQAGQGAPIAMNGPFPLERQEALARRLMAIVGFDFDHGRLDRSAHPFCGGVPGDVRITTRYDQDDPLSALMAVLHETGHALYEGGLPPDWRLQPVGGSRGMAVHESQSLLIEMQVCRGAGFIAFAAPLIAEAFGGAGPAWSADNLTRLANRVAPGLIRVDADEVTYPAHIILRTRLERALIAGELRPADLPGAWNEAMEELLGLTPPDDRLGCLQDIHWYDGALGYFPTYTLGAMTAAQLFAAAKAAVPEIPEALGRGDFAPLLDWLGTQIHAKGARLTGEDLLIEATGKPLDPEVFKAHLITRYLG